MPDEPPFLERWELSVFASALMMAEAGHLSARYRFDLETIPALRYLQSTYYERWLEMVVRGGLDAGVLSRDELEDRTRRFLEDPHRSPEPRMDPDVADRFDRMRMSGDGRPRPPERTPRYSVGDAVRVADHASSGHTRRAGYVRGRRGIVVARHGDSPLPETSAHGLGDNPECVYTVQFDGAELWGAEPNARNLRVAIDLWESYLEPVPPSDDV